MKLRSDAISSLELELCLPRHFKLVFAAESISNCLFFFSMDGQLARGGWVTHMRPLVLHKQPLNPIVCQALCWELGLGDEATLFCPHIYRGLERTCDRCTAEARGC